MYVNDSELNYLRDNNLLTAEDQAAFLSNPKNKVNVPTAGIEVKADWVPAGTFTDFDFDCTSNSIALYRQEINGVCYALVGLHIISKKKPKWLWATFEPQIKKTNPNRCNPNLYNPCFDRYGSFPKESKGTNTILSPALAGKFIARGKHPPQFLSTTD